jgi:antirestriction protein ArdC
LARRDTFQELAVADNKGSFDQNVAEALGILSRVFESSTYQQWQDKGAQVREGEKATLVVFWKFANDSSESQEGDADSSAGRSMLLFTRGYSVFNAAQVDRYTPKADAVATMPERIAHAEAFFGAIGAHVQHGGNQAFYAPATDHIQMPRFGAFADNVAYYSTLAHEHTHWTAPSARCDRQPGKRGPYS